MKFLYMFVLVLFNYEKFKRFGETVKMEAVNGQFPHQALMIFTDQDGEESICGGILISSRWLITAAHCVHNCTSGNVYLGDVNFPDNVYLGDENFSSSPVNITASKYFVHPDYNDYTLDHDIALVYISIPVIFGTNISPVYILKAEIEVLEGLHATMSGFGSDDYEDDNLKFLNVTIISNIECQAILGFKLSEPIICALSCVSAEDGDSGGPLTIYEDSIPKLIGLVSFATELEASPYVITGFVNIIPYLGWIQSVSGLDLKVPE